MTGGWSDESTKGEVWEPEDEAQAKTDRYTAHGAAGSPRELHHEDGRQLGYSAKCDVI